MTMDIANKEEWPGRKDGREEVLKEGRKEGNPGEVSVSDSFQTVSDFIFQTLTKTAPGPTRSGMVSLKPFIDGICSNTCLQAHS